MFYFYCFMILGSCFLVTVGCQSYESVPLNSPVAAARWKALRLDDPSVVKFAEQLSKREKRKIDFSPADGLTVGEAEIFSLVYNPDLRVARLKVGVAHATAEHAGRWDDPALNFDILKVARSVPQPWIIGSAISLTLPVSGRLAVEKSRAQAELHAELAQVGEDEWETLRKLRKAWLSWSADQLRLEQARKMVGSLDAVVETTSKLSEAGELPRTESALFRIERESRQAKLLQLQGRVQEGEHELRGLMGISPSAPVSFIPTLSIARGQGKGSLSEEHPRLVRLRSDYEVSELTMLREVRKQFPDLEIGPNFEKDQGQSRIGVVGGIPIPIFNSNRGGIAVARARREVAKGVYETERERMEGRLATVQARLEGGRARLRSLEGTLVPLVDRQVEDARRLLEIGEGGSVVLLESLVRSHEAKLDLIEARHETSDAENEIIYFEGPARRAIGSR